MVKKLVQIVVVALPPAGSTEATGSKDRILDQYVRHYGRLSKRGRWQSMRQLDQSVASVEEILEIPRDNRWCRWGARVNWEKARTTGTYTLLGTLPFEAELETRGAESMRYWNAIGTHWKSCNKKVLQDGILRNLQLTILGVG